MKKKEPLKESQKNVIYVTASIINQNAKISEENRKQDGSCIVLVWFIGGVWG